jgi:hypothetical protein
MDQIPKMFLHVIDVNYLDGYRLWLRFNNGAEGLVDLESELYGEIFEPLLDKDLFRQVYVTSRTIEWPNGADFAPEYLYKLAELIVEAEQPVLLQIPH